MSTTAHSRAVYDAPVADGPSIMGLMLALFDNELRENGRRRTVTFTLNDGNEVEVLVDTVGRVPEAEANFEIEGEVVGGPEHMIGDIFAASLSVVRG